MGEIELWARGDALRGVLFTEACTHLTGDLKGELVMEPEVTLLPARFLDTLLARETATLGMIADGVVVDGGGGSSLG